MTDLRRQRGNVFTILLAGVAMAGALSYIFYQTLAGPVSSMVRMTNATAADAQMSTILKAFAADTAAQGDCDSDGSIEPRGWDTGTGPTNGGVLPAALNLSSTKDPWGTAYGYCAWDVGSKHDHVTDNGCGANAHRLDGWRGTMTDIPNAQTMVAIVSAGPDRKFNTTCNAWSNGTTDVISASGDDVVRRVTYQEAKIAAGNLWTLQSGTPTTALLSKDLTLDSTSTGNAITAMALTTTGTGTGGIIDAQRGLQLGEKGAVSMACSPTYAGLLRYNSGVSVSGISVVKTAPKVAQSAAAASANIVFPRYTGKGASQNYMPVVGNTIIVMVAGYKSGGTFTLPDTAVTDNNGGTTGFYHLAYSSTDACNQAVKIYYRTIASLPSATYPFTVTVTPTGGAQVTATAMEVSGLLGVTGTSVTSNTIASSGILTFTTQTGLAFVNGQVVIVFSGANSMLGTVAGYNSGTGSFSISVASSVGSGTYANWNITTRPTETTAVGTAANSATVTTLTTSATTQAYQLAIAGVADCSNNTNVNFDAGGVTGAANNGSSLIRLTTASTADMTTGDIVDVSGVGGVPNATGTWTATVVDATHIDLQGSTWGGSYTSGGTIKGRKWIQDMVDNEGQLHVGASFLHRVLTAAGTVSHTWTHNTTSPSTNPSNTAVIVTFKGASASDTADKSIDYCLGSTSTWTAAGSGPGITVSTNIDTLYDGIADYTLNIVGLGQAALDTNRSSGSGTHNTAVGMNALAGITSGSDNTAAGYAAGNGATNTGSNTAIGASALASSAGAASNTAVGASALASSSGAGNTAVGYNSLAANAAGAGNTAFGSETLALQAGQNGSTAFGYQALKVNTAAANSAFGYQALTTNTSGAHNAAFGAYALASNTQGSDNSAMGFEALRYNDNVAGNYGNSNTAMGYQALRNNTSGDYNTAMGYQALRSNTTASGNTAAGSQALYTVQTNGGNTAAGYQALMVDTAANNTSAGYQALRYNVTGTDNTAIGDRALMSTANTISQTSITLKGVSGIDNYAGTPVGSPRGKPPAAVGDILIMSALADGTGCASFTWPAGFTQLQSVTGVDWGTRFGVAYKVVDGTEAAGLTVTCGTDLVGGFLAVYSGVAAVSPVNVSSATTTAESGATIHSVTGSLTTTTAGTQLLWIGFIEGDAGKHAWWNPPSGYTTRWKQSYDWWPVILADSVFSGSGATGNLTGTYQTPAAANNGGAVIMVALKPSSSTVTTTSYGGGSGNTALGVTALANNISGNYNTSAGFMALFANVAGSGNTAAGHMALRDNLGSYNTAAGWEVMQQNTGDYNTVIGGSDYCCIYSPAMYLAGAVSGYTMVGGATAQGYNGTNYTSVPSGPANTGLGQSALRGVTSGGYNTALGGHAMEDLTTGSRNTVVGGDYTLSSLVSGNDNTAIGGYTSPRTTGSGNTAMNTDFQTSGSNNTSLVVWSSANTTGSNNVAVGPGALDTCNPCTGMTAVGRNPLDANSTGVNNTAVGYQALFANTTGSRNSAFGWNALGTNATGSDDTCFEYCGYVAASNYTGMGYNALGQFLGSGGGGTGFGNYANSFLTTGLNTTAFGDYALASTANKSNWTLIGDFYPGNYAVATNEIHIGNGSIVTIAGQVAWTTASDRRLKKDIADSDLGLDFIMKLNPVSYRLKKGNGRLDYGFIAQDVQKVLGSRKTNMVMQADSGLWQLRAEDIIAPLVKAMQERQRAIERRQAEIDDLKAQIDAAETELNKTDTKR